MNVIAGAILGGFAGWTIGYFAFIHRVVDFPFARAIASQMAPTAPTTILCTAIGVLVIGALIPKRG